MGEELGCKEFQGPRVLLQPNFHCVQNEVDTAQTSSSQAAFLSSSSEMKEDYAWDH